MIILLKCLKLSLKNIGFFFWVGVFLVLVIYRVYLDLKNVEEDRNRLINFLKFRGIIVKDELVCIVFGVCLYILKKLNFFLKIDRFKMYVD